MTNKNAKTEKIGAQINPDLKRFFYFNLSTV